MGLSEIEAAEQKLKMNPAVAEIGESNGFIPNGSTKHAEGVFSFLKLGHSPFGLCNNGKKNCPFSVLSVSLVLNVILIVLIIVIPIILIPSLGRSCEVLPPTPPSPSTPTERCPDDWIAYRRKCYYFSDIEANWTYSQNYCASFNASLVVIESPEEMGFLRRYKGRYDHWIGLQRMNDQEPWKWINGTIFNNWFEIRGKGTYALLNHQGVNSGNGNKDLWICSKAVGQMRNGPGF